MAYVNQLPVQYGHIPLNASGEPSRRSQLAPNVPAGHWQENELGVAPLTQTWKMKVWIK